MLNVVRFDRNLGVYNKAFAYEVMLGYHNSQNLIEWIFSQNEKLCVSNTFHHVYNFLWSEIFPLTNGFITIPVFSTSEVALHMKTFTGWILFFPPHIQPFAKWSIFPWELFHKYARPFSECSRSSYEDFQTLWATLSTICTTFRKVKYSLSKIFHHTSCLSPSGVVHQMKKMRAKATPFTYICIYETFR